MGDKTTIFRSKQRVGKCSKQPERLPFPVPKKPTYPEGYKKLINRPKTRIETMISQLGLKMQIEMRPKESEQYKEYLNRLCGEQKMEYRRIDPADKYCMLHSYYQTITLESGVKVSVERYTDGDKWVINYTINVEDIEKNWDTMMKSGRVNCEKAKENALMEIWSREILSELTMCSKIIENVSQYSCQTFGMAQYGENTL